LLTHRSFSPCKSWRESKELGEALGHCDDAQGECMMPKRVAVWLRILAILLLATLLTPESVPAEGLRILTDLSYQTTTVDSTDRQDGTTTRGDFSRFAQLYDVDLQKELYPYLSLHAGGLFDLDTSRTSREGSQIDDPHTKTKERAVQYFAGLQLQNPLHKAGLTYRNSELKATETNFDPERTFREQYIAHWSWRPADLPSFNVDYNRTHALDKPETRDSTSQLLTLRSRYDYRGVSLDYTHTRSDNQEKLADSGSLTQIHNGAFHYSTRFFDDRVSLAAGSRLNYSTLEPSGEGDIWRRTSSLGRAFYRLDDPDPRENESDDFTFGASLTAVNIGGGASSERSPSVGLDFDSPTEVDTVYVLPFESNDQALDLASPAEIEDEYRNLLWQVWISTDGLSWVEAEGLDEVRYSRFDNRFEISFDGVSTRYIKVTIPPLPASNQISGQILISQVQGFTKIDGSTGDKLEDLDQSYNIGLRWAITDRTATTYDSYYKVLTSEPSGRRRSTLARSLSGMREFSGRTPMPLEEMTESITRMWRRSGATISRRSTKRWFTVVPIRRTERTPALQTPYFSAAEPISMKTGAPTWTWDSHGGTQARAQRPGARSSGPGRIWFPTEGYTSGSTIRLPGLPRHAKTRVSSRAAGRRCSSSR
jgi:hypothetical protein